MRLVVETHRLQRVLAQALILWMQWGDNMTLGLGLGSLTSELDQKETAFQSLPKSELMKKRQPVRGTGLPSSLTEALVAEKVLNDKAATAREMSLSMQSDSRTVAQQNEAELQNKAQQEVMQAIAGVYANKAKRANKNMQRIRNQGITRAPVQRRQFAAQGGIVGYQDGGFLSPPIPRLFE